MNSAQSMRNLVRSPAANRQQGAILLFCLIFLLMLTMLAVRGMEASVLESRMSGNFRDYSLAFQAAESGLQAAENWLAGQVELPESSPDGTSPVWRRDSLDLHPDDSLFWWQDPAIDNHWWNGNAISLGGFDTVRSQPHYVIELLQDSASGQSIAIGNGEMSLPRVFHRITSRAEGSTSTSEVILQSTYVKYYE